MWQFIQCHCFVSLADILDRWRREYAGLIHAYPWFMIMEGKKKKKLEQEKTLLSAYLNGKKWKNLMHGKHNSSAFSVSKICEVCIYKQTEFMHCQTRQTWWRMWAAFPIISEVISFQWNKNFRSSYWVIHNVLMRLHYLSTYTIIN